MIRKMSHPIILSDDESHQSPPPIQPKKQRRIEPSQIPSSSSSSSQFLIINDDDDIVPTPKLRKPGSESTPVLVLDTPMSNVLSDSEVSFVESITIPQPRVSSSHHVPIPSGVSGLVYLGSDTESEGDAKNENAKLSSTLLDFDSDSDDTGNEFGPSSQNLNPRTSVGNVAVNQISARDYSDALFFEDDICRALNISKETNIGPKETVDGLKQKSKVVVNTERKRRADAGVGKGKITKEERLRLNEEKKLQKEQEKQHKEALKIEAANMKKLEKEKQKWEKGKLAVNSIIAEIDSKVVELGSVGGHLLSRFSEKKLKYRVTSNPVKGSIVWAMTVPEEISELSPKAVEIPYILFVYEAEEFCDLVNNETIMDHVSSVRSRYPSSTICYLTNKLMAFIHKREQAHYKNPTSSNGWSRPPVEEVLAKFTTHFDRVHSRLCVDEAEIADHVVGLTSSLASCQFRKKLTRLSVSANGSMVSKDFVDKKLIKSNLWLKVLVAIPKVQPRFAMAIWKKYPTMKSLLRVYMDSSKLVHEKEYMLKDLMIEGALGGENRRLGEICSKRIYRIFMAQSGTIKTDDVEDGADFF